MITLGGNDSHAIVVIFASMSLFDIMKGVNHMSVLQNFGKVIDLQSLSLEMSGLKHE